MLCIIIIHSYTWHVHSALILEEIHHGHLFTHCINFNFRFHEEFHYLCCHISLISPGTNNKGCISYKKWWNWHVERKFVVSVGKEIHEVWSCLIYVVLFNGFWSSTNAVNHRKQTVLNFTHVRVAFYPKLAKLFKIRRFSQTQNAI